MHYIPLVKEKNDDLVWDKDTPAHLDFVTACANIRMYIFNIANKSRYDTLNNTL